MTIASLRSHTDAVVAALDAVTGIEVGDGVAPAAGGWAGTPGESTFAGYVIVYPLGSTLDGPLAAPDADAELTWQLTCVGATRQQCEWVVDAALGALVGAALTVTGRATVDRIRLVDGTGGTRRDDTTQPPVFIATPHVTVTTTPA